MHAVAPPARRPSVPGPAYDDGSSLSSYGQARSSPPAAPVSSDLTRLAAGELVSDATARDARETQMSLNLFPPASNKNLQTAGIKRTRARSDLDDDVLEM